MAEYNARIKHKRDTDVNWADADPVLLNGEIIVVDTMDGHVRKKVGDGIQRYSHLPFDDEQLAGVVQSLTNAQKEQARTNIGAGQPLFVVNVTTTLGEQGDEVYTADKTAAEIETAYQAGCEIVCRMSVPINGMGLVPLQLPLKSRRGRQIFMFATNQTIWTDNSSLIVSYVVTIADDGVNVGQNNTEIYIKPASGIPKSDLAQSVQTSLDKADTAISYDSQTLTEAQQAQARTNIGAGQPVFAVNVTEVGGSGGYTADKTAAEIEAAYQAGRTIVCKTQARFLIGYMPVELPLVSRNSRNQERVFSFAAEQLIGSGIFTITVNISDSGVEVSNKAANIYEKPADGIPKSDLAEDVQTSLDKADTAISLGLTAATPGQIIKVKTVQDGKPTEWEAVDDRLPKVSASDAGNVLGVEQIGEFEYGYALTHMPTLSDFIPLGITNASPGQFAKVSFVDDFGGPTAWEAADIYEKPDTGIPKTDLADDVQTSLNLAGTALQAVPDTYRTAAAQDELDMAKQPKAITDVGGHFGENPTVESALQQLGGALILRTWTD